MNHNNDFIQNGGAIKAINSFPDNILMINQSKFCNISAKNMGGVLYLVNQTFSIENSIFITNTARVGGVIYIFPLFSDSFLIIKSNVFEENQALLVGGAVYLYQYNKYIYNDLLTENIFLKNKAKYSENFSSPPFRIEIRNQTFSKNQQINQIPGISSWNFIVNVLDLFSNKTMSFLNDCYCVIKLKHLNNFSDIDSLSPISLVGSNIADLKDGNHYTFLHCGI